MRVYRILLAVILTVAIGFGVWYCILMYNDNTSEKDGLLVFDEYAIQWDIEKAGME